jgi:hypothetical protein
MARTARRPGPTSSRATILDLARRHFAHAGFDSTWLRAIATESGVDITAGVPV